MTNSKPRIIILEGPDGGGKSTLASDLAELGYQVRHTGPPTTAFPYLEYTKALASAVTYQRTGLSAHTYVFDRLHVGERVYGFVLRGEDKLGAALHRQLDRILLGIGGIVVFCQTDPARMLATWEMRKAKGDELVTDTGRYEALFTRYAEVIANSPITVPYDYMVNDVEFVDSIPLPWPNEGPGIGAWRPGYSTLLVGERVNASMYGQDWPFTGRGGSSQWLTEKLTEAEVPESDLYWVNAENIMLQPTDPSFIEKLQPRRIVALGGSAKKWLWQHGYDDVAEIEHPQYWRRFRHDDYYPIAEAIRGA